MDGLALILPLSNGRALPSTYEEPTTPPTEPDLRQYPLEGDPSGRARIYFGEKLGDAAMAAEIQTSVKRQPAPYKYPRDVRFIDALPGSSSGKLQHFALRRIIADEQASAPVAAR